MVGILTCIYATFVTIDGIKTFSWDTVDGTVISIETVRVSRSQQNDPVIVYQYEVDGTTYVNRKYTVKDDSIDMLVDIAIRDYPINSTIPVYYDPGNPSMSVLKKGFNFILPLWVFSAFMFASSIWQLKK